MRGNKVTVTVFQALRTHLCRQVGESCLQWFDPLHFALDETQHVIAVRFPHALFRQWFEQKGRAALENAVTELFPAYRLVYATTRGEKTHEATQARAEQNGQDDAFYTARPAVPLSVPLQHPVLASGGDRFTFENFLSNRKNQFPLVSALQVARRETNCPYNPFLVTGTNGSGKTHLLRAISAEARRIKSYRAAYYLSADELDDVSGALERRQAVVSLFERYDLILVDNLQRIAGIPEKQGALILLCDAAQDTSRQLVVACAERLSAYPGIHAALRSRLESGLSVELREPDLDIRSRYIQQQCREKGFRLRKEQILLLAQHFKQLPSLEGVLVKISAYCALVKRDINPKELEQILRHTDMAQSVDVSPDHIIRVTAEHFSLSPAEMLGNSRKYDIVKARQFAMLLCRELMGASYPAVGRIFGGKDHTTVMYAVQKILKLREYNKDIQDTFNILKQLCLQYPEGETKAFH